jgi:hypothetical protein
MRALASGSQANGYGGNVRGVIPAAWTEEEQRPWLGQFGAVCMKHMTINGMNEKLEQESPHLRTSFSISSRLLVEMLSSRSLRYTGPIFSEYPQFCEQEKTSCLPLAYNCVDLTYLHHVGCSGSCLPQIG